jgi:hypothetical protein
MLGWLDRAMASPSILANLAALRVVSVHLQAGHDAAGHLG